MIRKYIFNEFFKIFIFFFLALILLFWIADFFSNISLFLNSNASVIVILKYFILKTPQGLYYIIPFSVLTTSMTLFGMLNARYELIAFRTLGVNKKVIYRTALLLGGIFYAVIFFNNEFLVPRSFYQGKIIKNVYLKNKKNYAVLKADKIWYKKKNYIFKIDIANFDKGFMRGITLFKFDKQFHLKRRIDARYGLYRNKKWVLYNVEVHSFYKKGNFKYKKLTEYILPVKIKKEDFVAISSENRNLSFFQIYRILKNLESSNINTTTYKTDLISKFCYPFVALFFILLGFLLNIRNPREKGVVTSVILSVVVGFGFFIINSFFINLGYVSIIPFFIAPFLSFVILSAIVFILDKTIRY